MRAGRRTGCFAADRASGPQFTGVISGVAANRDWLEMLAWVPLCERCILDGGRSGQYENGATPDIHGRHRLMQLTGTESENATMRSLPMWRRAVSLAVFTVAVLVGVVSAGTVDAPEWGLAELMAARADVSAERARFVEWRSVGMLKEPVRLTGTLVYRAPDYFRKTVKDPERRSMIVQGREVRVEKGSESRTYSLGDDALLGGIVAAIRGVLSGDRQALAAHFDIDFSGGRDAWVIQLTPARPELGNRIRRITVSGRADTLTVIEIHEANGDRTEMRIE